MCGVLPFGLHAIALVSTQILEVLMLDLCFIAVIYKIPLAGLAGSGLRDRSLDHSWPDGRGLYWVWVAANCE